MMETTENPNLKNEMHSGVEVEEKIHAQRIRVSDHEKSDSFVMIDIESFSQGINKELSSDSRITLQRTQSRKGYQIGNEKIISFDANGNDRETSSANSPLKGSSTPKKAATAGLSMRATDQTASSAPQVHHQIAITTTSDVITPPAESRTTSRKNSFKRSSLSWFLDPKKVLLFFATLSSMGSILLILFTLAMNNPNTDEISLD